jgi:hypothetical protein
MTNTVTITIDFDDKEDVEAEVEYYYEGEDLAQTYWQPAEYAELIIKSLKVDGVEVDYDFEEGEWNDLLESIEEAIDNEN